MSARTRALTRALSLLRTLEAGGRHQLYPLASQYGVSVRTIRRDLYALEEAGFPIGHEVDLDYDNAGFWWLVKPPSRHHQPDRHQSLRASESPRSATFDDPGYVDR